MNDGRNCLTCGRENDCKKNGMAYGCSLEPEYGNRPDWTPKLSIPDAETKDIGGRR